MNLAVNARDAMPHGRQADDRDAPSAARTRLASRAPGDAGRVRAADVTDTGCGMTATRRGAHLRAVLHHQGGGQGHRPGAGDRVRHRQAGRRPRRGRTASRAAGTTFKVYLPGVDGAARPSASRGPRRRASAARHRDGAAGRGRGRRSGSCSRTSSTERGYAVLEARDGDEALAPGRGTPATASTCWSPTWSCPA